MRIGGIHIIDIYNELIFDKIKKIYEVKSIETIARKNIEKYKKTRRLFNTDKSDELSEEDVRDAYHYAELEVNSVQIMHQRDIVWSIFDSGIKNLNKKTEQISKKLLTCLDCPGIRVFTIEVSDALFAAHGYIDGILFFDFQIGSLLNRIGYLPPLTQQQYLCSRHFDKSNKHLIEDFFKPDHLDIVQKIYTETNPEHLAVLFEEMLNIQLFFNFKY